jgi:hypothetical protein
MNSYFLLGHSGSALKVVHQDENRREEGTQCPDTRSRHEGGSRWFRTELRREGYLRPEALMTWIEIQAGS